jgi:hypothetical protein
MSLDPRSRERLEALGRRLPQPLPAPAAAKPTASAPRHPLETEENPERLFRELMGASPDGRVPPHLLERLRELESRRATPPVPPPAPAPSGKAPTAAPPRRPDARPPVAEADRQLYATFAQLLLEQDGDG